MSGIHPHGTSDAGLRATLLRLALPTYVPIIVATVGLAMLVPVLPLYLADRGLSLGATSVVLAGVGIGASAGGLPAGSALARVGERTTMLAAMAAMAVSTAILGFLDAVLLLLGARVVFGAANAALRLSRQTYVTRRVPVGERGRAMSFIGGSFRAAFLVGPLLGGVLVDVAGFRTTFLVAAAIAAVGLVAGTVPSKNELPLLPQAESAAESLGLFRGLRVHRRRLFVAGWLPALVMLVREGRFVVLPLIADELQLSPTQVGAIVTVGTTTDLLLFPAAGYLMDRFGRLWAQLPAYGLTAVGLVGLGLSSSTGHVIAASALIGVGNGIGSGSLLTYGSDLAPADSPGPFLAAMGAIQDGGRIAGPLVVGVVGDALGLGASALVLAAIMAAAMAWLVVAVGESSDPTRIRSAALR